jgi:hypothetical protein
MLVGDIITDARLLGPPDPSGVLAPPTASGVTFSLIAAVAGKPALPAGTVYLQATYTNQWGQTTAGPETSLAPSGTQNILVSGSMSFATGVNVYIGTAAGGEFCYVPSTSLPFTIYGGSVLGVPATSLPGNPPLRNSCWEPDTDGAFAPASLVYQWLNRALLEASKTGGGIPDMTGAPSVQGQNVYTLPGTWREFSDGWFDGYQCFLSTRSDNWYQAAITSLVWNIIADSWGDTPRIETFPQCQRTSGSGTLSGAMSATDNVANVTFSAPGFVVPVGLALLGTLGGSAGTFEIITYTRFSTTQLTGVARGFGGTSPAAWPIGTNVQELNIRMTGKRYPVPFVVGNSALPLGVPVEWASPVTDFIVAQFKRAEHEAAEAQRLEQNFYATMRAYGMMNNRRTGRKQMGGAGGVSGIYFPDQFKGLIVP